MGLKFIIANKLFLIKKKKIHSQFFFYVADAEHSLRLTRSVLGS